MRNHTPSRLEIKEIGEISQARALLFGRTMKPTPSSEPTRDQFAVRRELQELVRELKDLAESRNKRLVRVTVSCAGARREHALALTEMLSQDLEVELVASEGPPRILSVEFE